MSMAPIITLSEWSLFIAAFGGLVVIIGATLYDMIAITRHHQQKTIRQSRLPRVTVLVYARESQTAVASCLVTLGCSQYPHFDVVIVDNSSSALTRQAVKNYQQQHPQHNLYLYRIRKATDHLSALRRGYKKSQHGEVVFVIDEASRIEPLTLHDGAVNFVIDPSLRALQLHPYFRDEPSISLLIQRVVNVSEDLVNKCRVLFFRSHVYVGEAGVFYQRADFLHYAADVALPCVYAGTIAITPRRSALRDFFAPLHAAVSTRSDDSGWMMMRRSLRYVAVMYALLLMTYFFYTAASLESSSLLMLSWVGVSLWFVVAVWANESATALEKIAMSFCIPMVYFLIYGYLCVRLVVVILRTVLHIVRPLKRHTRLAYQAVK